MSGSEIIFILLLALVVLGPEKLPEAMRRAGRLYGELKRMSSSFQDEFRSQIDEPMREMRSTADLIRRNVDVGAAQVDKPKSTAAMSVDMEPDPPPVEPNDDEDDGEEHGEEQVPVVPEPDDDSAAPGDTSIDEAETAPGATDGFGAMPSFTHHDEAAADKQANPEPTT